MKAILEAARHDADHALVPLRVVETQRVRIRVGAVERPGLDPGERGFVHLRFDVAPLAIQAIELGGERQRSVLGLGEQATNADRHVGKPSRRIETRARNEREVRARRATRIAAGDREEREQAGPRAARADSCKSVADERPIDTVERGDVGDRAQRDEIEKGREIRLGAVREMPARAQHGAGCDQHIEHHTDARQMFRRKRASGLIRIDDHRGRGQRRGREMMIGDQHVDAARGRRRDAIVTRDAVVDGDEEARRHRGRLGDDLRREPVAVFESIRHEEADVRSHRAESAHADDARRRAIGIVVGDDHDPLACRDRVGKPCGGVFDAFHRRERRECREIAAQIGG